MAQVEASTESLENQNRYRGYQGVSQDDDLFVDADDSNGEENGVESELNGGRQAKDAKNKRKRNRKKKPSSVAKVTNGKVNGDASASDKENRRKEDDIQIEIE